MASPLLCDFLFELPFDHDVDDVLGAGFLTSTCEGTLALDSDIVRCKVQTQYCNLLDKTVVAIGIGRCDRLDQTKILLFRCPHTVRSIRPMTECVISFSGVNVELNCVKQAPIIIPFR